MDARPTKVRHFVVILAMLSSVLLYLDRFCISFAERFIREDLSLTNEQTGWILSAFFWTYALAQVPTGYLTDRYGARLMLTLYILFWSLFTGLTGLASGFVMLLFLREREPATGSGCGGTTPRADRTAVLAPGVPRARLAPEPA